MIANTKITIDIKDLLCTLLHNKPDVGCTIDKLMVWNELVESFRAVLAERYPNDRGGINFIFKEILDD